MFHILTPIKTALLNTGKQLKNLSKDVTERLSNNPS
jgi:hypothetical protein